MKKSLLAKPTLFTRGLIVGAILAAAGFSSDAEIFRKSQIVDFPTGNLGSAGLEGWAGSTSDVTVTNGAGSLDGTPLGLVVSKGDRVFLSATTNNTPVTRNVFVAAGAFRPDTDTNIYYSFLVKFNNAADVTNDAGGELLTQVNRQNAGTQDHWQTWVRNSGGQIQLGIRKRGAASPVFASTNVSVGQTLLVVVRQHIIPPAGTNDIIDLWINPDPNTLGGDVTNAPPPILSVTGGNEDTSNTGPGRFYPVAGANWEFDELRIANSWGEVTPSPLNCNTVVITSDLTNSVITTEDLSVMLSVVAGGTSPNYQWQVSLDSGANWNAVTNGTGLTSADYTTPNLTMADDGNQYRCLVSVDCDSSSLTSAVATVTVLPAVVTPPGLIMDDTWADLDRTNAPITTNNSIWYASHSSSLVFNAGLLFGAPAAGESRLWIGYFTDDTTTNLPVSLEIGGTIKATWVFKAEDIVQTNGDLRVGLFDYADGGTRLTNDGFAGSEGNGEGVRGYMTGIDFAQTFTDNSPLEIRARTVLDDINLIGTTGLYTTIGSGPTNLVGAPGLVDVTDYTLELSVSRVAKNSVDITASISGGGTNWTLTATDSTYAYHRFDAFAIRAASAERTASSILFEEFKVEVTATALPFGITSIQRLSADAVKLTWDAVPGVDYQVRSRNVLGVGNWMTNATITATSTSQSYTNTGVSAIDTRYYRVVAP